MVTITLLCLRECAPKPYNLLRAENASSDM